MAPYAPGGRDLKQTHWGVVGLGRAGQARVRAISAREAVALVGTAGRRPERGTATFEALCADPTIDGIIVCSENAHHYAAAKRGLEADKHVIVEFPLAASAAEARALYALAAARERVLHCELIGLLTARHRATRRYVERVEVERLHTTFTARLYRWVADEAAAGRVGQLALARLHAFTDWFGPLTLVDAECERGDDGYRLAVELEAGGVSLRLDERRGPTLSRASETAGRLAGGAPFAPPTVDEPGDLFGQDLDAAVRRIETGGAEGAYVDDATVVEVLALAEEISAAVA